MLLQVKQRAVHDDDSLLMGFASPGRQTVCEAIP